ncbi:MAG: malto-oligosyltrehalose synthase, partial [Dehalococcoidia bacterium]|nr:malto-oligosyltrehalose synthase [Dehalococcoidia bacterium]
MGTSRIPVSTCRLQLNRIFGFREVMLIASYLRKLGISDVYLSPVFRSRPGSTHGYDITDPRTLNPELGSSADFQDMVRELKRLDMGILLDIVPNHLAADAQNPWWMDVLENGPASPWAQLFDIDWQAEVLPRNRLLLPVLGNPALEVINKGEILLKLDGDGLSLHYFENRFPLDVRSYGLVLSHVLDRSGPERVSHARNADPARLLDSIERLPPQGTSELWHAGRYRERQAVKAAFTDLLSGSAEIKDLIFHGIEAVNNRGEGDPSLDMLKDLLEQQAYILDFWKTGLPRVNYRRFFDISDLAGVRVENPEFMDATHSLIYDLVREGRVTGLRIDHIDGLRDPLSYLRRLHSILSPGSRPNPQDPPFFLLVEKILTGDEVLPPEWPAHGTTGYDFLNVVNAVFIDPSGLSKLVERYGDVMDMKEGFEEILYRKKKQVMDDLFRSEIKASARRLAHLAALYSPDVTAEDLQQAVIEMTACLPVYRTYIRDFNLSQTDRHYMEQAAGEALRRVPSLDMPIRFLKRVLFMESPLTAPDRCKDVWLDFVMRWQQLTGAVMAKGHEDTALYNYSPLISINEVGG